MRGSFALSTIARLAGDPARCREALTEGETILAAGAVSHNYFLFYRNAIDVALAYEDWRQAERYAAALEAYTKAEPVAWADLIIARGRALAGLGGNRGDRTLGAEIAGLKGEATRLGLRQMIPALDSAAVALGAA